MKLRLLAGCLAAIGIVLGITTQAIADVTPPSVTDTLAPGESITIKKTVDVPATPPRLDFCLLVDLSGSYGDDIASIRSLDDGLFDAIQADVPDLNVCTASFVDFPIGPWGNLGSGDYAYQLDQDLTSTKATWTAANDALVLRFGGDGPESQYPGLHQIASGSGIDVTGNCPAQATANVAPGGAPSWRTGATHVVGITTDAPFHVPGDPSILCPAGGYPGPTHAATIAALAAQGIKVIAIKAPGSGAEMDQVAADTGGTVVTTTSSSSDIADAITAGLAALTFDITAQAVGCDPLVVTFAPPVHEDVAGPTTVSFDETISVPAGVTAADLPPGGTVHCKVEFLADGGVIGTQEIWITVELNERTTLTCDDLSGQQRQLSAEYKPGWALFGPNKWWLFGPIGAFTTKSCGFHPNKRPIVTSNTIAFVRATKLVQFDILNHGTTPSNVSISCDGGPGTPTLIGTLSPGAAAVNVATGWTSECLNLTVTGSNGKITLDNLVLERPPLGAGDVVIDFQKPGQNTNLVGQYPAGVVDWGTGATGEWWHSGPTAGFPTKSLSLRSSKTQGTFTFVGGPRILVSLQLTTDWQPSTQTLKCAGNPDVVVSLTPSQYKSVATGWTVPCASVTIVSSNGWGTNYDNLLID
jgi:hypothetical protein